LITQSKFKDSRTINAQQYLSASLAKDVCLWGALVLYGNICHWKPKFILPIVSDLNKMAEYRPKDDHRFTSSTDVQDIYDTMKQNFIKTIDEMAKMQPQEKLAILCLLPTFLAESELKLRYLWHWQLVLRT
ncbi:MAG TPA: hypothetical protein VE593_08755, partial [Nitrososphaeraceae archaeon]|nr:hypothetical protein [Nitrososphaeraceae archaeon]